MPYRVPMIPPATTPTPVEIEGTPTIEITVMPDVTVTAMPEISGVEEQYQLVERKALAVTEAQSSHAIVTTEPKVVTLIADGCDMQVDTAAISADSPKIVDKASFSMTLKGVATTIYAKAGAGETGTLYIAVFK